MDRANLFTDHRIQVLQFLPSFSISEQFEMILFDNSPTDFNMVINMWCRYFVELLSRLVCQFTISFHTFLGMTFHIVGPRRNTKILRAWQFFSSSRGNSGFKHGSVIVNNIFAYFTLSFSTSQENMIKERCWFSQINFFIEYFPHRINVLFPSSQFYVIHIHR